MPMYRKGGSGGSSSTAVAPQGDQVYQLAATNVVMASPPVITTSATATITGQVVDLKTDPRIRWPGPTLLSVDTTSIMLRGAVQSDGVTYGTTPTAWESFEFMVDCASLEIFLWAGGSTKGFVMVVDGQRHTATADTFNGDTYLRFDFGGRKSDGGARRVQFTCNSCYFKEVRLAATDTLFPVQARVAPKLVVVGDSYGTGYAASAGLGVPYDGFGQQLARLLGYQYRGNACVSNTGFVKTNAPYGNYVTRVQSVVDEAPAVVMVTGSVNDTTYTSAQVGTAAAACFAAFTAALPDAIRVCTGILSARSFTDSGDTAKNAAIAAAAAANGFTYIDVAGWVTGTGRTGATNGSGNSDIYTFTDTVHPTKAGGYYFASRLASELRRLFPTFASDAAATGLLGPAGPTGSAGSPGSPSQTALFTTAGTATWTKPAGAVSVTVTCVGGGGGGGGGRRGAAASARVGGGGGGGGGITIRTIMAADLASSMSITIGAAGVGGVAATANDTSGGNGTNGGPSYFGGPITMVRGGGGGGGVGGGAGAGGTAGGAGTALTVGTAGGAANATGTVGTAGGNGGGPTGGGSGGGITTANAASNGGPGGANSAVDNTSAVAGVVDTTQPGTPTNVAVEAMPGAGGGGGASSNTIAGQNGANGGKAGGGGGGGGASLNGSNSGKGGDGAGGSVLVVTYF